MTTAAKHEPAAEAEAAEAPPEVSGTILFNGTVIDEPLVNSHVVGVAYDPPADPEA